LKKTTMFLILLAILLVAGVAFALYEADRLKSESFSSTYVYEITLWTDATLREVTLVLPLPETGNYSPIRDALEGENVSGKPETWNITVVDRNAVEMLQIHAAEIVPIYRPPPVPTAEGESVMDVPESPYPLPSSDQIPVPFRITVTAKSDSPIDTRSPLGHEPLLYPRFNSTEVECGFPHQTSDTTACFEYESVLYASYDSPANATVSVDISLTARNEWWMLGWTFNEYQDHIYTEIRSDPGQGQVIPGELVQGIGSYS
jgi:hypothetical protein